MGDIECFHILDFTDLGELILLVRYLLFKGLLTGDFLFVAMSVTVVNMRVSIHVHVHV